MNSKLTREEKLEIFFKAFDKYKSYHRMEAYKSCKDEFIAKDLVDEVFFRCYENIDKYNENISKMETWISIIFNNYLITNFVKNKRLQVVYTDSNDYLDVLYTSDDEDSREILIEYISKLKNKKIKDICHMFYLQSFSVKEISIITDIGEQVIKNNLLIGRKELIKIHNEITTGVN